MSLLEQVRAAGDVARRHAEMSSRKFSNFYDRWAYGEADGEALREEYRLLSQEMRRKIDRAKGALRPEDDQGAELLDALENMGWDAIDFGDWVARHCLGQLKARGPGYHEEYAKAARRAEEECERWRQRVSKSAERALALARDMPEGRGGEESKADPPPPSGAGGKAPPREPPRLVPSWNRVSGRVLRLGREVVLAYTRKSSAQFAVLDALEAAGWPDKGVKLPEDVHISLKDTIDRLNKALIAKSARLRFTFSDKEVGWHLKS
jgi:hypothetical protein